MSCPSGSPWYSRCDGGGRGKSSGRVLGMHDFTKSCQSFWRGRGSSSKGKEVLEVLVGKLQQILADFPVLGRVQITGHKKGWAGFS